MDVIIMGKRGFTLVEMLAAIILLAILMGFATVSYSKALKRGREKSFDIAVNSFSDAVISAYTDCSANLSDNSFCTNHSLPNVGSTDTIYLSELVRYQYIEQVKNPYNTNQNCDDNSYVKVTRKNVNVKNNNNSLDTEDIDIDLVTCLICGDKRSGGCNQ